MQFVKNVSVLLFTTVLSFVSLSQLLTGSQPTASGSQPPIYESNDDQDSDCNLIKWFNPNTDDREGRLLLKNCSSCHVAYYKEWIIDKHSMSQSNPLFLAIYEQFREDHPDKNGNCALCHNPEAALDNNLDVDLRLINSRKTNGISCDFCHKIESIDQNPLKKGIEGIKVLRACKGQKDIRFGPIKDPIQPSKAEELKYNSLFKTSLSCAKCHDGSNGNVRIYSTFTEWLNSPASKRGVQCQSCHMQPRKQTNTVTNQHVGKELYIVDNQKIKRKRRPYYQIHSHSFLTKNPHDFRKKYLNLKVSIGLKPSSTLETGSKLLTVTATVENNNFGHSFPTGSPMRNAILLIEVKDRTRKELKLLKGPRLPSYAGDLKNKPGKLFAKILNETSSEYANRHGKAGILFREIASELGIPAQDWWNVYISQDTRLKANEKDVSVYEFDIKDIIVRKTEELTKQSFNKPWKETVASVSSEPLHNNNIEITAKLIWRNTWPGLAKIKGFKLEEDLLLTKRFFL